MEGSAGEFFAYWKRVRQRTMAVAMCVPQDRIDWNPGGGTMSFGDLLRHIAITERWLFVETACGRPSRYTSHGTEWAASLDAVTALMTTLHVESTQCVGEFCAEDWDRRVTTPGGAATLAAWKWLRAMLEHEVHHRGQLYMMLRLSGVATPPIFGLTSEEVRAVSSPR